MHALVHTHTQSYVFGPVLYLFHLHITTLALKDLSHFARSADRRLQLNVPPCFSRWSESGLTMLFRHRVGNHQGNQCTQLLQNTPPGCLSSRSQGGLILGLKEWHWCTPADISLQLHYFINKVQLGNNLLNLPHGCKGKTTTTLAMVVYNWQATRSMYTSILVR